MTTAALAHLELGALAQMLFASPLQPSECASPMGIRAALAAQLRACQGDPAACLGSVAQQAGDEPDLYAARMRWALHSVAGAYPRRFHGAGHRPRAGVPARGVRSVSHAA
jgi:hypothetical protein